MNLRKNMCILLICAHISLFAELPVAISIETKAGYNFTEGIVYAENESIVEKEFDVLKGLCIGLENLFVFEQPEISDEITLALSLSVLDFLAVGIAPKIIIAGSAAFALDGLLILGFEIEKIALAIEDENEFLFNFRENTFEYVNTLAVQKMFTLSDDAAIGIGFENELAVSAEGAADGFTVGPVFSYKFATIYINYALGIVPEAAHGIEGGFVLEF